MKDNFGTMYLKPMYKFNRIFCLLVLLYMPVAGMRAQYVSQVWNPDLGNGKYKNPVLYADYSDPDVCAVGNDYYLPCPDLRPTASSATWRKAVQAQGLLRLLIVLMRAIRRRKCAYTSTIPHII